MVAPLAKVQQQRLAAEVVVYDKAGRVEAAKESYFWLASWLGFEGADDLLGLAMSPAERSALLARLGVIELPREPGNPA